MVQNLNREVRGVQGLILTPTRELANQDAENIAKFGKYAKVKVLAVYGGESINKQVHALANGVQIVVGTPGRLIDLMERRVLNLGINPFRRFRRSRPHARHGLHRRHRIHTLQNTQRPPNRPLQRNHGRITSCAYPTST